MTEEAIGCYVTIQEKFPKSPYAEQVTPILRRLDLAGKPVQLAGPTLAGEFVNIKDYRGRVVLIVFWSTDSDRFLPQLPLLISAEQKFQSAGLEIIGVNLDEDELGVDAFLQQNGMTWPQVFHTAADKRRWNNPIVKYYGVRDIPSYWLIDQRGIVFDTQVDPERLDESIQELLLRGSQRSK